MKRRLTRLPIVSVAGKGGKLHHEAGGGTGPVGAPMAIGCAPARSAIRSSPVKRRAKPATQVNSASTIAP